MLPAAAWPAAPNWFVASETTRGETLTSRLGRQRPPPPAQRRREYIRRLQNPYAEEQILVATDDGLFDSQDPYATLFYRDAPEDAAERSTTVPRASISKALFRKRCFSVLRSEPSTEP